MGLTVIRKGFLKPDEILTKSMSLSSVFEMDDMCHDWQM
jgi:hypothetical protein